MLKIMRQNRVRDKYIQQYFSKDELKRALDYEYLVKNGMVK